MYFPVSIEYSMCVILSFGATFVTNNFRTFINLILSYFTLHGTIKKLKGVDILIYLIIGFLGAFLMFCGDMLLYYDPNDFDSSIGEGVDAKAKAIIAVMSKIPSKRLIAGGLIGPVAAFLYCIGFYHIIFISDENARIVATIAFLLLCLGIITGGAYHSHCAYLGLLPDLLAKEKFKDAQNLFLRYFQKMIIIVYAAEGIGFILLAGIIVSGHSLLPRWMFLLSPIVLFLLKPAVARLPKGVRIIISGGWTNLISVIYHAVAIVYLLF